jgi:hypothetical protein
MQEIYSRYKDRVEFLLVYTGEAHPTDGWQSERNIKDNVLFRQHQSFGEREEAASSCSRGLRISLPILIEEMDNTCDEAYGAAPVRLYVIGEDGKVAYHGGAGPHFLDPDEWEQAIKAVAD